MTGRPRGLLDWLAEPTTERGLRTLQANGSWQFYSYSQLACAAFTVAARLRDQQIGQGDRVALALEPGPDFVAGLFGCFAAGATAVPLALPSGFEDRSDYQRRTRAILAAAEPACLLTGPDRVAGFSSMGPACPVLPIAAEPAADSAVTCGGDRLSVPEHALLQFTSGSTGQPKGVRVSTDALAQHLTGIRDWLGMSEQDPTATWLPLHHDMGLVGGFLTPITTGGDLWLMRPEQFVRSPLPWLTCLGSNGATLTAAPNFGLEYVVRKVSPDKLAGLDFSQWRALIIGAERIDSSTLAAFQSLLAGHRFSARTFLPAYGLAEATLAVTGLALADQPRTVYLDRSSLVQGAPVRCCPPDPAALALVGCGQPLAGNQVGIVGADGESLPDGSLGEIVVAGPSVAEGHVRADGAAMPVLHTGDLGALLDGELFVLGRAGDSVKRRARTVFAEDLESLARGLPQLRHLRPIVLLGTLAGQDTAVVVVKCRPGQWIAELTELLATHTEGLPLLFCLRPAPARLRTSSGKPRRLPLWSALLAGELVAVSAAEAMAGLPPAAAGQVAGDLLPNG